ncbi:MAG: paraquat-inducible protein A [Geminicoccaceae bacterium]
MTASEVIACHECGTVHRLPPMADDTIARCRACGATIYIRFDHAVSRTLALYLAALAFVLVANSFPILTMSIEGQRNAATILDSATALYSEGMWPLAIAIALAGIVMPLTKILGMIAILLPMQLGLRPSWLVAGFRFVDRIQTWAMMEVYLLGVIVAYVKLQDLARVEIGIAAIAFVATIVLLAAADARFDPHTIWRRLGAQASDRILAPRAGTVLLACEECDQLLRADEARSHGVVCPRCGSPVHRRKPDSITRTWALLLTAAILYVPANLLPVLTVISFGHGEPSTIVGGVVELIQAGMMPVALLVLFASVVVPVLKLMGLAFLLVSVQRGWTSRLADRTRLYRIIEGIGRWSMVDVFMTGILAALVALGNLATITAGAGAVAFCAVVIVTIFASMSFDPRLMWDVADEREQQGRPLRV